MKDALMINSLIGKENDIIRSYKNYITSVSQQEIGSIVEDSIVRHNNHVEALKRLSEEVR